MTRLAAHVDRRLGVIERGFSLCAAGLVFVLTVLTVAEVIARYLFNSPIPGTWELSQLMLVGIVFLGLADAQAGGRHVRVELFIRRLDPGVRRGLELMALALGLVMFIFILWAGARDTWRAWDIGDYTLGSVTFPVWPSKLMVPAGSLLLVIRFAVQMMRTIGSPARPEGAV
jgi:TRAP-type C4-dicarboxylate transport system permease small subunit